MSGYDQIKQAQENAKERERTYKRDCAKYICRFCDDFATQALGVPCGKDERVGVSGLNRSDTKAAYIHPPYFDEENLSVFTRFRVESVEFDVVVRQLGESYVVNALDGEFTDAEREGAFAHIKSSIIAAIEDDLDRRRSLR